MNRKRKTQLPDGISVISLRIPEVLHNELRSAADQNDRTVSQEARRAIALHIGTKEVS